METFLASVQAAVTLSMVVVAYAAFRMIHRLGHQVGAQANAVTRAVELGSVQRRDAARPVLALTLHPLEGQDDQRWRVSGWCSRTPAPDRHSMWS